MALNALLLKDANGLSRSSLALPRDLITGTGATPKPRLRVDVAQTSFFEGREFRSYLDFSIPANTTLVTKFVSPIDFVLNNQTLSINSGNIRLAIYTGGTEGGSFTALPVIGRNRMSERPTPFYVPLVTVFSGGTHTGGTEVDVLRAVSDQAGSTIQSVNVGFAEGDERGLPAGTYYARIQNLDANDASVGIYSIAWEERAASSSLIITL